MHKDLLFTSTRRRAVFKHMVEVCFMKHNLQRDNEQFKVNGEGDPCLIWFNGIIYDMNSQRDDDKHISSTRHREVFKCMVEVWIRP